MQRGRPRRERVAILSARVLLHEKRDLVRIRRAANDLSIQVIQTRELGAPADSSPRPSSASPRRPPSRPDPLKAGEGKIEVRPGLLRIVVPKPHQLRGIDPRYHRLHLVAQFRSRGLLQASKPPSEREARWGLQSFS